MYKSNLKKMCAMISIVIVICLSSTIVQAALQSNPTTHYTTIKNLESWSKEIRAMEGKDNALGLNETFDEATLLGTSGSNNLDSHLSLGTEWGTIAILSASIYGNNTTTHISTNSNYKERTTTGNKSGVYIAGSNSLYESNATTTTNNYFGADPRYYNSYGTDARSAKAGDGLGTQTSEYPGTAGWHGASYSYWFSNANLVRAGIGGIFDYNYGYTSYAYYGRATVVVGEGL